MKHAVGSVDAFAPGTIEIVEAGGRSIGIVNADGTFYGVLNVCPHALAPICRGLVGGTTLPSLPEAMEYDADGHCILRCPWHGYEFDLAAGGRSVIRGFKARVRMFPVTVEDGQVLVEVKRRSVPAPS